jgi:hypothetical protein
MLAAAGAHAPRLAPVEEFVSFCLRHERPLVDSLMAREPGVLEEALRLHPG